MISLIAKAVDGEAEKYGKLVSEPQTDITVIETSVSGTLEEINNNDEAFDEMEESGCFPALECETEDEVQITTQLINGENDKLSMDRSEM